MKLCWASATVDLDRSTGNWGGGVTCDWNPITRQMISTWERWHNSIVLNQHSMGTRILDLYQAMMALCHFQGTQTQMGLSPHTREDQQKETWAQDDQEGTSLPFLSLTAQRAGGLLVLRRGSMTHHYWGVLSTTASLESTPVTLPACRGVQLQVYAASQKETIAQVSKVYVVPYTSRSKTVLKTEL